MVCSTPLLLATAPGRGRCPLWELEALGSDRGTLVRLPQVRDDGTGKPWENHGKTIGKCRFTRLYYGFTWMIQWDNIGILMDLPSGFMKHGWKIPLNGGVHRKIIDKLFGGLEHILFFHILGIFIPID